MARIYYNIENGINLSNQPNEIEDDGVYFGYAKLNGGLRDRIKYQLNINIVHDDTYSTPYEYDPISGLLEFNVRDGEYRVEITYSKIEELKMILMDYTLESNRLVKDDGLFFVKEVEGTFKEECDLINPTIKIEIDSYPSRVNYIYISLIDKFYFVDNITILNNKLYELSLTEDVLMTFQSEIKIQEVFVERNQNEYNEDFPDTELTPVNGVDIDEVIIPNDFFAHWSYDDDLSRQYFLLTGYGLSLWGVQKGGSGLLYREDGWLTTNVGTRSTPKNDFISAVTLDYNNVTKLTKLTTINDFWETLSFIWSDNRDYLTSLTWFPFPIPSEAYDITQIPEAQQDKVGALIIADLDTNELDEDARPKGYFPSFTQFANKIIDLGGWDTSTYNKRFNDFRDYNGYTDISIYLPYFGFVDVPVNEFYSTKKCLRIFLDIDYYSGQGTYYITTSDRLTSYLKDCRILLIKNVQLGYSIPFARNNATEVARNSILAAVRFGGQTITDMMAPTTNMSTTTVSGGNFNKTREIKSGRRILGKETVKITKEPKTSTTVTNVSKTRHMTQNTTELANSLLSSAFIKCQSDVVNSSFGMIHSSPDIIIVIKQPKYVIERNNTYKKMFGLPLREIKRIQELSGYTLINDVHLDLSCLSEEETMIEEALLGGIII